MKYRTLIKALILIVFILLLYFILSEFKPRKEINSLETFEPDGIKMKYIAFNKNNQKSIEVRCAESKRAEDDKTLMKKINATIFKKGKLDQEIYISADRGYSSNNINRFFIEKNARIHSKDLEVKSESFTITSRNKLSTEKVVQYTARGLKGIAYKGLVFYLKLNVLKLFDTEGIYNRDAQKFDYKTTLLWVIDKNHSVVFEKGTEIKDKNTILRSDQLNMIFDEDFKQIKQSKSNKNSYLFRENQEKNETIEIKSKSLHGVYTKSGELKTVVARRNARVIMKDPKNLTEIFSPFIKIEFQPQTGQISKVWMTKKGQVKNSGTSNFWISAQEIHLWFRKGEMIRGEATKNCKFHINDYHGHTKKLTYDVKKNLIHLIGDESTIKKDQNTFISRDFVVDTKQDILSSSEGIKSIILPEKKNALFSTDSIFINSKIIEIHQRDNKILYKNKIRLQQDDTILTADNLEILDQNKMDAQGSVSLLFKDKEEEINLRGDNIVFDPEPKTITIKENGILKNKDRMLNAKYIRITFNKDQELDNIYGENEVRFIKDKIQGNSKKVNWEYKKEIMIFLESAQIKSQSKGITRGDRLRLDLKDNKIMILSDQQNRSETIIE
ncbi:MAG: hypothetical protein KAT17_02175 [Candidatus Aminicenantes bacterium]|nr:hypothetical protein [Candidatus Aminicenantes bacterium]